MGWISAAGNAIGSVVGGIQTRNAVQNASRALQQGAKDAQALEKSNQDAANQAQQSALTNVTTAEQPYQSLGSTSANHLSDLLSKGFTAPNPNDVANTPEYKFALSQGTDAIDKSAAANGTLFSGTTGTALEQYGQGLASEQYQQAYQDALNTYTTNYSSLLGGTNAGLTSTGQLTNANLTTAGNTANIDLTSGLEQAQQINNAAAARAQGDIGSAAAWNNMIGGLEKSANSFGSYFQGKS